MPSPESLLVIVGSLLLVTLGAEWLVRGASLLALRAGVSPLFVGLTIVGLGTSAPELSAGLVASARGAGDLAVGNVVGSNITNVALILGATALVHPIAVRLAELRRDLLVALAAAFVPFLGALFGGTLPRGLGIALVASLALHLVVAYRLARRAGGAQERIAQRELEATLAAPARARFLDRAWACVLLVLLGLGLLVAGARLFVDAAVALARELGISELVIGLTVVALGTSLPELVTSIVAALRKSPDIAIGNVIGSNIFNVLGILGTCAIVHPPRVAPQVLGVDAPVMVLCTLALLPILRSGGRVSRGEGLLLIAGYLAYTVLLFTRG